jgi:transposase-like protein
MPSPYAVRIELTESEREQLESWSRRHTRALALRARVVLAAAEDLSSSEVARRLGVGVDTVRKWRNRFAQHGLAG